MSKYTKKGYFTVEAAIFLPIFIIALVTLAYLIRIVCIEERVNHVMIDEGRYLAARAYDNRGLADGIKMGAVLAMHLDQRYENEIIYGKNYCLSDFRYLYNKNGLSGIISYETSYECDVKMPLDMCGRRVFEKEIVFRGFIGADNPKEAFDYEYPEMDIDSEIVWVFPVAGGRYHAENCPHIKVFPKQVVLTKSLAKKFKSCSHCNAGKQSVGNFVYIFPSSGNVYHKGDCFIVDRYVISIDRETAEQKGYTRCKTCGGGIN